MRRRLIYFGLTLLGAGLLALAWPPNNLPFLFFIGFTPFLFLETFFTKKGRSKWFGLYTYLGLFVFNLITTWWVWNASNGGAVFMLLANSFLMLIPFLVYHKSKRIIGQGRALFLFIVTWLAFEYIHFRWGVAYPWLTLGNGFATSPDLVQWYEFTGVLGGSLWVLAINALIFNSFSKFRKITTITIAAGLIIPIICSVYLKNQQTPPCKRHEILVIQPNIDPYKKFQSGTQGAQIDKFISLCEAGITKDTKLVMLPETALVGNMNEDFINQNYGVRKLKEFLNKNPGVGMLVGASTHRFYGEGETLPPYPRYFEPEDKYYDSYNTALQIDADGKIRTYHKSKLVPGVESLPFPNLFKHFDNYLDLNLGGESGNLGRDQEAKTFHYTLDNNLKLSVAPLICYESIFGEYVGDFVNQDADFLAIITNDGWWGNTPGHRQHMHYARLRAIEYRRYVVRSANTGISCVIDDNGKILDQLGYWEDGFLNVHIPKLTYQTFYAKSGDYIGKLAIFVFLFLGLSVIVKWINQRTS
ncbi:MAG: apolipoprotein N-acyltransferase [Bacteroidia bacterium]|jgi:apolipoprotein N-acyltransferase